MMQILALVTARGGSKGFPGKNTSVLAGRSLTAWAMHRCTALAQRVDGVAVFLSTDSPEIAASVPAAQQPHRLRPAALAADTTSSHAVVQHELEQAAREGRQADAVLLFQPTSPLVSDADLDRLVAALRVSRSGSAALVTPVDHPVEWNFGLEDGVLTQLWPGKVPTRRQECRSAYRLVGVFACTVAFLEREKTFYVPAQTVGVPVDPHRGVDVDSRTDLALCRAILEDQAQPPPIRLGKRMVGSGHPCFVIAAAGVNHNGSLERALELVGVASESGADAVMFQTFKANALASRNTNKVPTQAHNTAQDDGQLEVLRKLELPSSAFITIKQECDRRGIIFLSNPLDSESAHFLRSLDMAAIRVHSGETTHLPFVRELAGMQVPLILSAGMGTLAEVEDAVGAARTAGVPGLVVLHGVHAYPSPAPSVNLRAMESLRLALGVHVGYADHTLGLDVCLASVARGACVVEKHFTLSRELPGPDHQASLEPGELRGLVQSIRRVEAALGGGVKNLAETA